MKDTDLKYLTFMANKLVKFSPAAYVKPTLLHGEGVRGMEHEIITKLS